MINLDGATLVFPTSFGYFDPHMLAMAAKFPDVQFRHCGGMWTKGKHPMNTGSYFGYIGLGQYLNGIVAGHTTKSKKIGFVAAKPIPQVLLNINSFLLGARSVDPAITCQVIFTGEWSLAVKEAEATNALVDQGVDVITCHVDSPKVVVETAAGRGAFICGYHANQSPLAPEKYLTGAEWNWANVYKMFVDKLIAGEPLPNFTRGGLADGFVKMSPLGPGRERGGAQAVRRHAGRDDEGRLLRHQGAAEEQQGRCRRCARARRSRRPRSSSKAWTIWSRASSARPPERLKQRGEVVMTDTTGGPAAPALIDGPAFTAGLEWIARRAEAFVIPLAALIVGMALFSVFIALLGKSPAQLFELMWRGGFGSWFSIQNTLSRAAPLLLAALCVALPARLGLVVIGGEGAIVLGGVAAAAMAVAVAGAPSFVGIVLMGLAGMVAGGIWIGAVGALRHYRAVNETISSLLMAYIAIALMNHLVEGPLRDPGLAQQAVDASDRPGLRASAPSPAWTCIGAWSSASSPA